LLQESTVERPPEQGWIPSSTTDRNQENQAKEYALRQEKAFLRTFAAGQKYVAWRAETCRFCFEL
jgi:hypothetical protein